MIRNSPTSADPLRAGALRETANFVLGLVGRPSSRNGDAPWASVPTALAKAAFATKDKAARLAATIFAT